LRSIELSDLLLKYGENATGGVTSLELGSERVGKKVALGASFICFQGIIENRLEVGRRRCGSVSVRHKAGSDEENSWFVGPWVTEDNGTASQTGR
jgi:hypothetical protein